MKKTEKKYDILISRTKEGIKSIGQSKWAYSQKYVYCGFLIALIIGFIFGQIYKDNKAINYTMATLVLFMGIYFCTGMIIAGNKFWDKVKDLPEPKDLREIK